MSELRTISEAAWNIIRAEISTAIEGEKDVNFPLRDISSFITTRRTRNTSFPQFTLQVLRRGTSVTEWGTNRGIAELEVEFGITTTSFKPEDISDQLTVLAFALAHLFLDSESNRATLFDTVRDVRIEEVSPDAIPEGMEETTQPWAVVRIVWDFEFLRP